MIDGLLSGMRDTVLRTLPDDVTVQARDRTRTPTGGSDYTWSDVVTVKGRIASLTRSDIEIAQRLEIDTTNAVIVPHDAGVTPDSRLLIGGVAYDVSAVFRNESWPVLMRVLVAKAGAS